MKGLSFLERGKCSMAADAAMLLKREAYEKLLEPDLITGSEILLRCLLLEGTECVFGYPGGAVLPIYDALYGFEIKHILARHEQGAIHAADGYARATGKPGVVIATSGPGATNLVTGIATAQMDSIPLVVITGNVPTHMIGTDAFQEADITGITMPITKHNYLVRKAEDIPKVVREAFYIASTGRPGPVLIDIPKDVSSETIPFHFPNRVEVRGYHPAVQTNSISIERMCKAIVEAKRPIILAGGGVVTAGAQDELLAFAEKANIPVTTTLMGLGGFSGHHPLWMGMPGMHGTYAANQAIIHCDLLINIGARFDDRITMGRTDQFATGAKIIHIDIDPAEHGKNVKTFLPIIGDVKNVLQQAIPKVEPAPSEEWIEGIAAWKRDYPLRYKDSEEVLKPQYVIQMISDTTEGEAIVTTDVGQHQMWVAQYYTFKHARSMITSGGLGTMGFGFPSAIGAQMAYPDRTVVSINGDGGIQMNSQELAVCAIHNIPVKVVIINNQVLGMVRQWQELFYDNRYSHIDLSGSPDFVKLAEAYGVKGLRATNKEEARAVWQEALDHPGPVVVEFVVHKDENVYPMVASGRPLTEMVMGDEDA
jgi:acetolactate synthase-1/2/3 large subunit